MKLLTFRSDDGFKLGLKTNFGVIDVSKAAGLSLINKEIPQSIEQVLEDGKYALEALSELANLVHENKMTDLLIQGEEIEFGPCVPNPKKIICVGLNYKEHAEESNQPIPEYPILFNKFSNTVAAHQQVISLPFNSNQVDYEAELVIVMGQRAKRVSRSEALNYVFGYCAVNDLSARDLQMRTSQWLLGKCCDGFSPLGPYLVTADEVGNPNQLSIRTIVNGEVRQDSNTSDMIFYCNEIVSYISQHMTLEPGDIILTGTPQGVILGYPSEQQEWLKEGDEVTVEIEKLGSITNRFIKEL